MVINILIMLRLIIRNKILVCSMSDHRFLFRKANECSTYIFNVYIEGASHDKRRVIKPSRRWPKFWDKYEI